MKRLMTGSAPHHARSSPVPSTASVSQQPTGYDRVPSGPALDHAAVRTPTGFAVEPESTRMIDGTARRASSTTLPPVSAERDPGTTDDEERTRSTLPPSAVYAGSRCGPPVSPPCHWGRRLAAARSFAPWRLGTTTLRPCGGRGCNQQHSPRRRGTRNVPKTGARVRAALRLGRVPLSDAPASSSPAARRACTGRHPISPLRRLRKHQDAGGGRPRPPLAAPYERALRTARPRRSSR